MQLYNIYDAKTHLSQLIADALAGKEVIIAKAGKPVVKLDVYKPQMQERKPGLWKGKIWMSDNFNDEDEEINKMFYGED